MSGIRQHIGQIGPPIVFVNKVLLEQLHSFILTTLGLQQQGCFVVTESGPQSPKALLTTP
jgi:hypothetical protein